MTAYVIMIRDRMIDADAMATYAALARRARGESSPKPLAFYGETQSLEGLEADGAVILEFPDMDAARAWYHSSAYQEALPHRLRGADYRVLLVDGVATQTQVER